MSASVGGTTSIVRQQMSTHGRETTTKTLSCFIRLTRQQFLQQGDVFRTQMSVVCLDVVHLSGCDHLLHKLLQLPSPLTLALALALALVLTLLLALALLRWHWLCRFQVAPRPLPLPLVLVLPKLLVVDGRAAFEPDLESWSGHAKETCQALHCPTADHLVEGKLGGVQQLPVCSAQWRVLVVSGNHSEASCHHHHNTFATLQAGIRVWRSLS